MSERTALQSMAFTTSSCPSPISNARSAFYERVLGAERILDADHHREDDGSLYAHDPQGARPRLVAGVAAEPRAGPKASAASTRSPSRSPTAATLERWAAFLDGLAIPHSPILTAIQAWVMAVADPDGHRFRLYTRETHGRDMKPDENDPWLQG